MNPDAIISLIGIIRERAYRFLRTELESHGMQGLAPSHGSILSHLFSGKTLTMSDLAQRIDRDRSTITTLVGKLEEHGYVVRTRDENDGRVMYVRLTDEGRRLEAAFHEISARLLERTFTGMSQEDREVLASLLSRVAANWA
jgi:DNA-binding MarR family transcriptional regulator